MATPISRAICNSVKTRFGVRNYGAVSPAVNTANRAKVAETTAKDWKIIQNLDDSQLTRVVVAVRAGSRHESRTNRGITHFLRHAIQIGNANTFALNLYNTLEVVGSTFSTNTGKETAYLCYSGSNQYGMEAVEAVLRNVFRAGFSDLDWAAFAGCQNKMLHDLQILSNQPNVKLMENLHSAAYRDTLGNPLYASRNFIGSFTKEQTSEFIQNHYSNNRVAIVTSGVDEELYQSLTGCLDGFPHYAYNRKGAKSNDEKARYTGGEAREEKPDLDATYVAVATEGPKLGSQEALAAGVLQAVLGQGRRIKYSLNPEGPRLNTAVSKALGDTVFDTNALNINYSDSGLFGFVVAAPSDSINTALSATTEAFANVMKNGITDAELQAGKTKLATAVSMTLESKEARMFSQAEQSLAGLPISTPDQIISQINKLTAADVNKVAKQLSAGKFTMSSIGNLAGVPYLDELKDLN